MISHVTCLTMKVADWVLSHRIQLQPMILTTLKYQNGAQKALKKVLRYHKYKRFFPFWGKHSFLSPFT